VKKGWETKKLGEICDIERGGSPRPIQEFITTDPNGINWIKIGDATASGKYIYKTEEKIKPEGVKRSRMVYEGDFILSNSMSFGRPYIMKTTGCIHDGWLVLHKPKVDPDYLYHALSSDLVFDQFDRLAAGSTVRNLNIGLAKSVEIPYPPLDEQRRIVGLLDEAFEGIATAKANAEKNLQNARALFSSHLNSVFSQKGKGWVGKRLEEIGKTQTGSTPRTADQTNYGDFISFVKPGDFNTDGTLDYDKDGLSESGAKGARIVPSGSVLMVCIGATIGKCGYCDQDVTTNQQVNALTPSDGSSNRFIYYQMLTETFQRKVIHASGQATLPIINKSKWSALSIWLPPKVAEQKKIADQLDALSAETQCLAAIYKQKLAALEELKKSLLYQAFNGEL
jgi:type I restriction enzyme S subunit